MTAANPNPAPADPTPVTNGVWVLIWRGRNHDKDWESFETREDAIDYLNEFRSDQSPTYWLGQVSAQWLGDDRAGLMESAEVVQP